MGASTSRLDSADTPTIATAKHGNIIGTSVVHTETGRAKTHRYTGIPYACPPLSERRWRNPAPLPESFRYDSNSKQYDTFADISFQPANPGLDITPSPPRPPPPSCSEDCLLLNIWVPAGLPPKQGFPVLFFIHGGWLQSGNPNQDVLKDPSDLIGRIDEGGAGLQAIVVAPGYRLGVLGFLAMEGMPEGERGNFGFRDQRLALEWTYENIDAFGGNRDNITLGGLSAGAHSAHSQALYEYNLVQQNPRKPLFRRIFLQSNAATMPAKSLSDVAEQVAELCRHCGISPSLSSQDQLEELRNIEASKFMEIVPKLDMHTFRAVSGENEFVKSKWLPDMVNGGFGRWCRKENIVIMMGECANEDSVYSLVNPPTGPDFAASLRRQLDNYYSEEVAKGLMHCCDIPWSSTSASDWAKVFGQVVSDSQVYANERLFVQLMVKEGPPILRYRIEYRPAFLDQYTPTTMGVGHTFDDSLWWFCTRALLEPGHLSSADKEKIVSTYLEWLSCFVSFVAGEDVSSRWYGQHLSDDVTKGRAVRKLNADLTISVAHDDLWDEKAKVIECLRQHAEKAAAATV
ncbi:hypothetical protein CBS101457_003454 [Exobasidium rhododendri]|nr:hypothetical protein CBS101457_003454 [Exobasidium rhododendri]